jgi:tRNA modification GTPase
MTALRDNADTIAACATPAGEGGIAVLRVSGPCALAITDISFRGGARASAAAPQTLHYGTIVDGAGEIVDTVVVSVFRAPHSYTGEDTAEISCHGGYFISQTILAMLLANGARMAAPGEFTLRAFLNGKLDLSQAEAVNDLIRAKTEKAHKTSVQQLEGKLSRYVRSLRSELLDICSLFELELDFSEEDITLADRAASARDITRIIGTIDSAVASYAGGKLVRDGVRVVLAGKPNAGKSSLLNILLDENRAIVSHIPGTTRDSIEESISLNGLLFTFIDTAGLRETVDEIEQEGVRRTQMHVSRADVVVVLIDASVEPESEDAALYKKIEETVSGHAVLLYVLNKSDKMIALYAGGTTIVGVRQCSISCKTHEGIDSFKDLLYSTVLPVFDAESGSVTVTNIRHKRSFELAAVSLGRARDAVAAGLSGDLVAVDLRDALDHLGAIIGITTPDDILNNIFSKFCIGK